MDIACNIKERRDHMKKLIGVIALAAIVVSMLAACGKFTCDICGEEKSGKKHEEEVFGMEVVYCDDCYDALNDLADSLS